MDFFSFLNLFKMSIWLHMGYFEIINYSLEFLWIHIHEIDKEKTCILTTWQTPVSIQALIGWLQVQGYPGPVMDFFSFLHLFKYTLCNNFKQAVGPGVLQTFSTCAVKP